MNEAKGTLEVLGPTTFTYLQVLGPDLREVGACTHQLTVAVPPGIYRVRARVPGDQKEQLVAVEAGATAKNEEFKLQMDSPTPLPGIRSANADHTEAARRMSHKVHARIQKGKGRLFLFARGSHRQLPTIPPRFTVRQKTSGIEIHFPDRGKVRANRSWLALTLDLPAGIYALEHEVPMRPGILLRAQALYVEEGKETQVFMRWDKEPDFARAVVHIREFGDGFDPSRAEEYARTEAALESLLQDRLNLAEDVQIDLWQGGCPNPMLGLIACYSLLKAADPRQEKLDVERLNAVVGSLKLHLPHSPDVRLLELLAAPQKSRPEFNEPLLFAAGTNLLMQLGSEDKMDCRLSYLPHVFGLSWLAEVAPRLTTGSIWTRWESDVGGEEALSRLATELGYSSEQAPRADASILAVKLATQAELPHRVVEAALRVSNTVVENLLLETVRSGDVEKCMKMSHARFKHLFDYEEYRDSTLSRAWEHREEFRGETVGEFLKWLRSIAWSLAIDRHREGVRRRRLLERFARMLPIWQPSVSTQVETKDYVAWLLAGLNDRERKLLHLKYFEGYSIKQVARELNTSPSAVTQLHYRAISKLRDRARKSTQ